jgi:hypothetical protein
LTRRTRPMLNVADDGRVRILILPVDIDLHRED